MRKFVASFFVIFLVCAVSALGHAWGHGKNLGFNKAATDQIRAFDREFFRGFDVYSAGVEEAPTALLFDIKDDRPLPSRFWKKPLTEEEIIYAIRRLDDQYIDSKTIPFEPRALNIVNLKGEVLGYCYTGLNSVFMDRKKNGSVTVFPPTAPSWYGGGEGLFFQRGF